MNKEIRINYTKSSMTQGTNETVKKSLLTIILCEDCAVKVWSEETGPNLVGGCQLNAVQYS